MAYLLGNGLSFVTIWLMARLFRSIRDVQVWIFVSVGFLMISVLVFAFIARKPLCIDSKLVERIDSISSQGTATAYRCGLHKHVEYNEKLSLQIKSLNPHMQVLEKYFDWMGLLGKRVSLTVIADSDNFFRVQGHQIFIGEKFLQSPGEIEKIVLKIWLSERIPSSVANQAVLVESLSDFLYFTLNGNFNLKDLSSGLALQDMGQLRWPRVLNHFNGYCRSSWKLNEDISRCQKQLETTGMISDRVDNLSLRPLLTQSLIAAFEKMKAGDRMRTLLQFSDNIRQAEFAKGVENISAERFVEQFMTYFSTLSSNQEAKVFSILIENELRQRGFSDINQSQKTFDYIVYADDLEKTWLSQLKKANERWDIAIDHKGMQIANEESAIALQSMDKVHAKIGIMVSCGDIDFDRIKSVSKKVEKLLYIKFCDERDLDLLPYFEKGVSGLATKNKNIQFIEFHMPSLRLALKRTPSLDNVRVLQEVSIQKRLFDYLGWQEPDYDGLMKAYRAKSVIEAVDWYRL